MLFAAMKQPSEHGYTVVMMGWTWSAIILRKEVAFKKKKMLSLYKQAQIMARKLLYIDKFIQRCFSAYSFVVYS